MGFDAAHFSPNAGTAPPDGSPAKFHVCTQPASAPVANVGTQSLLRDVIG